MGRATLPDIQVLRLGFEEVRLFGTKMQESCIRADSIIYVVDHASLPLYWKDYSAEGFCVRSQEVRAWEPGAPVCVCVCVILLFAQHCEFGSIITLLLASKFALVAKEYGPPLAP